MTIEPTTEPPETIFDIRAVANKYTLFWAKCPECRDTFRSFSDTDAMRQAFVCYVKDRRKTSPFREGIRAVSFVSVLCNQRLPVGGRLDILRRIGIFTSMGCITSYGARIRCEPSEHSRRPSRTSNRFVTTSIHSDTPHRSSGTSVATTHKACGTKRARFPMTGNSNPNSKATNAIRTFILNPVSAFSKNSLRRSTAGSQSVGTAIAVPDRPATANVAIRTHALRCRSKRLASSMMHSFSAFASRKDATSKNTVRTSYSVNTRRARTWTSPSGTSSRFGPSTNTASGDCTSSAEQRLIPTHRATERRASIWESATLPPYRSATKRCCSPVGGSKSPNTTTSASSTSVKARTGFRAALGTRSARSKSAADTSTTPSRNASSPSASGGVSVASWLATSEESAPKTTGPVATGVATETNVSTDGRSASSRRCSNTRAKPPVSRWSWIPNATRRKPARYAATRTVASASSAVCTTASNVDGRRTPTRMARRTFDKRYSRIQTHLTDWIEITAVWHSQQCTRSMLRMGGSIHKNGRVANPNIPTAAGNPRPSGRGGCQFGHHWTDDAPPDYEDKDGAQLLTEVKEMVDEYELPDAVAEVMDR